MTLDKLDLGRKNMNNEINDIEAKLEVLYAANRKLSSLRNDFLSYKQIDKNAKNSASFWRGRLKDDLFDSYYDEMIRSENNYNNIGYLTTITHIGRQIERLESLKRSKKSR